MCASHLQGTSFATPIVDKTEVAAKKKREELDKEIELIRQEYEEKIKKKKKKAKKDKDKEVTGDKVSEDVEKEKNEKVAFTVS